MSVNLIGRVLLDQFRVDSFVAAGGMGAVYRVYDTQRQAYLAMKVLHADFAEDPSMLKRFQREADVLKKLSHPNIVPFYGLYETIDFYFLVQRYIEGLTLKQYLKRQGGWLPEHHALTFLKSVSSALGYAHSLGVVHCDVKPGNIIIDRGGAIYMMDFGIARHADSVTTTLAILGTPAYMSPEQCMAQPVSAATDVYSLGVMLFEMLTGVWPFRGTTADDSDSGDSAAERVRKAHINEPPPDPREFNPDISPAMVVVLNKALAKQPAERYASTRDMFLEAAAAAGMNADILPDRIYLSSELSGDGTPATPEPAMLPTELPSSPSSEPEYPAPDAPTYIEPSPVAAAPPEPVTHIPPPRVQAEPPRRKRRWPVFIVIGAIILIAACLGVFLLAPSIIDSLVGPATEAPVQVAEEEVVPAVEEPLEEIAEPEEEAPPEPEPTFYGLAFCDRNCEATGAQPLATFPGDTDTVYYKWDYENMPHGIEYARIWYSEGELWARIDCVWAGPEHGTMYKSLFDRFVGLRAGTWTIDLEIEGHVVDSASIYIDGSDPDFEPPAGQTMTCSDWE